MLVIKNGHLLEVLFHVVEFYRVFVVLPRPLGFAGWREHTLCRFHGAALSVGGRGLVGHQLLGRRLILCCLVDRPSLAIRVVSHIIL